MVQCYEKELLMTISEFLNVSLEEAA